MRGGVAWIFLPMVLLLCGCATLTSVRGERGRGSSRVYQAPFETVWKKANQTLKLLQLGIAESNQKQGYLLAETGISAFSWGERVAVFVERIDTSSTRVEVISRKVMATNIFAENWESRFLDTLEVLLNQ